MSLSAMVASLGVRRHEAPLSGPIFPAGGRVVAYSCGCGFVTSWWGLGVENNAQAELLTHQRELHASP